MSRRTRSTAIALTAAVAVSSIAYGLGSQRGDGSAAALAGGSAAAARDADRSPFEPHRGLSELADRLGVSTDKLEAALEDIRGDRPSPEDHHAELAEDLAAELGVSADRVTAALERLRGERGPGRGGRPCDGDRGDMAADLAEELGVSRAAVRDALEQVHEAKQDEFAAALAQRLGVSAAKVEDVLESLPHHGRHRRP